MKSTTFSAASLAFLGTAQAGLISRQASFNFDCNGKQNPNPDDCRALFATFTDGTATYNHPQGTFNILYFDLGKSSNCRVEITFLDREYTVTGNQVYNGIDGVGQQCFSQTTGGNANDVGGRFRIGVRNNPNYVATPPAGAEKREAAKLIPQGRAIEPERIIAVAVPDQGFVSKRHPDDTSFTWGVHTTYAKPAEFKTYVQRGLGGTSTWEWSQEQSVSNSITLSAEVTAGIEGMLSSTLKTEISETVTTTSGSAQSMTVVCGNDEVGQVYFQAYAEIWRGALQPSGDLLTITKPMTINGETDGFYQWECTQK